MRNSVLEGAVVSLRLVKHYLRDAYLLFRAGSYAGACVLGTVAFEHLGQCRWLMEQWDRKSNLQATDCAKFKKSLEREHQHKIQDGLITLTMPISPTLAKMTEKMSKLDPSDPDLPKLAKEWEKAHRKMRGSAPLQLHDLRIRAQYLSLDTSCHDWISPLQVKKEEVELLLLNAGNAYRTMLLMSLARIMHEALHDPTVGVESGL